MSCGIASQNEIPRDGELSSEMPRSRALRDKAHGFTLIELLVVVLIIAILASAVVVNFPQQKSEARLLAQELVSLVQRVRHESMLSGKIQGLHLNKDGRELQVVYRVPDDVGKKLTGLLDGVKNKSSSASVADVNKTVDDELKNLLGLGLSPDDYSWQKQKEIKAVEWPEHIRVRIVIDATSSLAREMEKISEGLDVKFEVIDNKSNELFPDLFFYPSGAILPEASIMLLIDDEQYTVSWSVDGEIGYEKL